MTSDEEDDWECPLCLEEMDVSDRNFKPCPCGYQICRFCYNHIKENLNGRCPACRREYSDQTVQFTPLTPAELQRLRAEKKQKEREKREMEANNRRHLDHMRVVQKNLVYVIGLSPKLSNEELLRQHDYFGQYGKILKIVINRKGYSSDGSIGVYVTFARKEDAARCIFAVDGTVDDGRVLKASYGTTKYCTFYLRGLQCQNPGCMYLHESGEEADSYTKEEMAVGKHHSKIHPNHPAGQPPNYAEREGGSGMSAVGPAAPFGPNASAGAEQQQQDDAPKTPAKTPLPTNRDSDGPASSASTVTNSPSNSALPRTAAWAARVSSADKKADLSQSTDTSALSSSAATPTADGRIECSIFDEIYPVTTKADVKKKSVEKDTHRVNTAILHRYLILAQDAREYYLQLSAQLLRNMDGGVGAGGSGSAPSTSPFLFDPFREEEKSNTEGTGNDGKTVSQQQKSRFEFAQQSKRYAQPDLNDAGIAEMTDRFDRGLALSGRSAYDAMNIKPLLDEKAPQFNSLARSGIPSPNHYGQSQNQWSFNNDQFVDSFSYGQRAGFSGRPPQQQQPSMQAPYGFDDPSGGNEDLYGGGYRQDGLHNQQMPGSRGW